MQGKRKVSSPLLYKRYTIASPCSGRTAQEAVGPYGGCFQKSAIVTIEHGPMKQAYASLSIKWLSSEYK